MENFTHTHALEWLRDKFGERRAACTAVAHREQSALEFFERQREERERERELVHDCSDGQERGGGPEREVYDLDR